MNATEHWVTQFLDRMNCVSCRSYDKPLSLYFHSGTPVDVKNTPIEEIESRIDYIDAWCNDCTVYRSTRARAVGRLATKKEAAALAKLSKAKWFETPSQNFVIERDVVANKREFVDEAKNTPCMHCGVQYPTVVMDFFHLLPKGGSVRQMTTDTTSLQTLLMEMEKCTLLCANCTRIMTRLKPHICLPLWRYEDHQERIMSKLNK